MPSKSPHSLRNLPVEILLSIFEATYKERNLSISNIKPVNHYLALSLACSFFHDILTPLIWNDVLIRDLQSLRLFQAAVHARPERANLVRSLAFDYHTSRFAGGDIIWTDRIIASLIDQPAKRVPERHNLHDILQLLLSKLRELRRLDIRTHAPSIKSKPECSLDLTRNQALRELCIQGHRCSPVYLANILSMPLDVLRLELNYDETVWDSFTVPKVRSTARQVTLYGTIQHDLVTTLSRNGVPGQVVRSSLACLRQIENLTLSVRGDTFQSGELNAALSLPHITSGLDSLCLKTESPIISKRLDVDFPKWSRLETLDVQSIMFWPVRDSWHMRGSLYKSLPPTLKYLCISFPNIMDSRYGVDPFDGAFQMNTNVHRDYKNYRYQEIPASRYDWLLNLLKCRDRGEDAAAKSYWLPNLERIYLSESDYYSVNTLWLSCQPQDLPASVSSQLLERNIVVDCWAIDYTEDWMLEDIPDDGWEA